MSGSKLCSVAGCGCEVRAKGWCQMHYKRWRKHGSPGAAAPRRERKPLSLCGVDGCERHSYAHGFCFDHYNRNRDHGTPHGGTVASGEKRQWIDAHVGYENDDCLKWPYCDDGKGYGVASLDGKNIGAHRLMCLLAHGEPPTPSHQAAHSCGNGALGCVNPRHLRWATVKENHADKKIHGTHLEGEMAPNSVLSAEQVREIRRLRGKKSCYQMAEEYGVSPSNINNIHLGKSWKSVA